MPRGGEGAASPYQLLIHIVRYEDCFCEADLKQLWLFCVYENGVGGRKEDLLWGGRGRGKGEGGPAGARAPRGNDNSN